jgi:hypothetical protein
VQQKKFVNRKLDRRQKCSGGVSFMRKIKLVLSMVLCFAMIFNPVIYQAALYAQDTEVEETGEETGDLPQVVADEAMDTSSEKAEEASEKQTKLTTFCLLPKKLKPNGT